METGEATKISPRFDLVEDVQTDLIQRNNNKMGSWVVYLLSWIVYQLSWIVCMFHD